MNRFLLTSFLLFLGLIVVAQEIKNDTLQPDTTVSKKRQWNFLEKFGDVGLYYSQGRGYSTAPADFGEHALVEVGALYNNWSMGAFFVAFNQNYEEQVIFPTNFLLSYTYGGGYAGRRIYHHRWFRVLSHLKVGLGSLLWEEERSLRNRFREELLIVEPEIAVIFTPISLVHLKASAGYRFASFDPMPGLENNDISAGFFSISLMVGYIKLLRDE
jgi:hypothetical protein